MKKVCEIAKERGIKSEEVIRALKELGSGIDHHLAMVDDETAEKLVSLLEAKAAEASQGDSRGLVKYWCRPRTLTVARTSGGSMVFKRHVLLVSEDSPDVKVMGRVMARNPDVFMVLDKPYAKEEDLVLFEKKLSDLVFSGASEESSRGGIEAVLNMFTDEEIGKLGFDPHLNPRRLIRRTVDTKSLVKGNREGA